MIKSELIQKLVDKFPNIPEDIVGNCVNSILTRITMQLADGDRTEIRDFGVFTLRVRAPHKARNPKTGEKVETTKKYSPHFKPGKALRERVDASKDNTPIKED